MADPAEPGATERPFSAFSVSGLPGVYHGSNSLARASDFLAERTGLPEQRENASLLVSEAYRGSDRSVTKLADLLQGSRERGVAPLDDPKEALRALVLVRGQMHLPDKASAAERAGLVREALFTQLSDGAPEPARFEAALMLEPMLRLAEGRAALLDVRLAKGASDGSALRALARRAGDDASMRVREALAAAVATFCGAREGADELALGEQGQGGAAALASLVSAVAGGSTPQVVRALALLAASSPAAAAALLDAGAAAAVMALLERVLDAGDGDEDADLSASVGAVLDCLAVLRALCAPDAGKEACLRAGAAPFIMVLLGSESPDVRQAAVGVCALMALLLPAKRAFLAPGPEAYVPPLLALLGDEERRLTASTAVVAVRMLSEVTDGRGAFMQALVEAPALIVRVFGASAAPDLLHMLDSPQAAQTDRAAALGALARLCQELGAPGLAALADSVGVVAALGSIACATSSSTDNSPEVSVRLRDRSGRLVSVVMRRMAIALLSALAARYPDMDLGIRIYCERVTGAECTFLPTRAAIQAKLDAQRAAEAAHASAAAEAAAAAGAAAAVAASAEAAEKAANVATVE